MIMLRFKTHGAHLLVQLHSSKNIHIFMHTPAAHTPDNSFLGFVINSQLQEGEVPVKKQQGLVYGKERYMWEVSETK